MSDLLWSLVWLLPAGVTVLTVVAVLWWILGAGYARLGLDGKSARRQKPRDPASHLAELRRDGAFWAVMVRPDPKGSCAVAEQEKRAIFLLHQAPVLPFDECPRTRCQCSYAPLRERRRRDVLPPDQDDRRAGAKVRWYRAAAPAAKPARPTRANGAGTTSPAAPPAPRPPPAADLPRAIGRQA